MDGRVGWMDRWVSGADMQTVVDERTDGLMDGWTDKRMDGQVGEWVETGEMMV